MINTVNCLECRIMDIDHCQHLYCLYIYNALLFNLHGSWYIFNTFYFIIFILLDIDSFATFNRTIFFIVLQILKMYTHTLGIHVKTYVSI